MKKTGLLLFFITFSIALYAQKNITLEDIWKNRTFLHKGVREIRPMNDGEHYCVLEEKGLAMYAYKTGSLQQMLIFFSELSLDAGEPFKQQIQDYTFSQDETKILFTTEMDFIYRHSFVAQYFVYDRGTKKLTPLSENGAQRLAEFSPDGKKVAFVRENNLFVKMLETGEEQQLTKEGKRNEIIYGSTDWVYEEEFAIDKGFFWNNSSTKLAYYRFDESKVKEFGMTIWGDLYPENYIFKYPKAGDDNSVVDVFVYDMLLDKHQKVDIGEETDIYIPRMQWTEENNKLCVHRLNRLQNHYEILLADVDKGETKIIYSETNRCYIEQPEDFIFLKDKEHFLMKSERSGFMHIQKVNLVSGKITPITSGNFDVFSIDFVDEKKQRLFYTAAESAPYNRELFSIGLNGKKKKKISGEEGTYTAYFSKNGHYLLMSYSHANRPPIYTINNSEGKHLVLFEDNAAALATSEQFGAEKKEFSSFVTENGDTLFYWIIKPAKMDANKEYPLLLYVYGGPGSQEVRNSYSRWSDYFWFRMLAQKGYVVACVDGRGTGARGEVFKKCTYQELGKYETEDQIQAAKYFGKQGFIDKNRIGIFGWSYGGYMSTLCLTKGADYFKTGIAVAPVTNWRYYDNIYTERFMRKPQDNAKGYDLNSPIHHVDKLRGNYLLIHGSADDNVHLQNAMDLVTALVSANKQFEMFVYPNKNHSIYGGNTRLHLYQMMTDFILRKL